MSKISEKGEKNKTKDIFDSISGYAVVVCLSLSLPSLLHPHISLLFTKYSTCHTLKIDALKIVQLPLQQIALFPIGFGYEKGSGK